MSLKNTASVFSVCILAVSLFSPLSASMHPPPVELAVYCNPPEVPPGATLYGEAVVSNNEAFPLGFVIWGGIFEGDELVEEIGPVPGFINAWDEHLFPIPVHIPQHFELGRYRIELAVGPEFGQTWRRDSRLFSVKYPPPIKAALDVTPGKIGPFMDIYASLSVGNMTEDDLEFSYRGVVKHNDNIVAHIEEEWITLDAGSHAIVPISIDLPGNLFPGIYRVVLDLGHDEIVWLTTSATFDVVLKSPVGLRVFVNPFRTHPGETVWASALLRNETGETVAFKVWGAVTHREILYKEIFPQPIVLGPGAEFMAVFPIDIAGFSPFGLYNVKLAIGPDIGREWTMSETFFWVRGVGVKESQLTE